MRKLTLIKERLKNVKADIENRQDYIGGSDVGVIMNANEWKSPYTLWAEKTGLIETEDISDVEAVWWGTHMEDLIAERFTIKTGLKVAKSNYGYTCEEYPYLRGHVDRLGRKGKFGLECKTTSSWNKTDYNNGEIPPMHYWQCQFYMMLTGYDTWYLATKRDNQFYVLTVKRDEGAIEQMLDTCESFWNHVQNGEPVEIDGSNSTQETIDKLNPESTPGMTVDLNPVEDTLLALLEVKNQGKRLETLGTQYENEIKDFMGEAEKGETAQFSVSWKTNKKGSRVFRMTEKRV